VLTGVSLIDIGQLDVFTRNLLHCLSQFLHLRAVLFVGRRNMQGQEMTQRIHSRMHLRSLAALGSIVAAAGPDSGVDCNVRLSRIMAVGWPLRPANSRNRMGRSSTIISKHRASIHRRICW